MPISYCSVHERAFDERSKQWINFPRGDLTPLERFYAWLHDADIEASEYEVIETRCDLCEQTA